MSLPLLKLTTSIQTVNMLALIITLCQGEIHIRAELLCSCLRYIQFICYLSSIFMSCSATVHLWLVITRRNLKKAAQCERWYFVVPFALAFTLSAILAALPNTAYGIRNRCLGAAIPSKKYLIIRWCLYYGWFVISSAIAICCMISVLISARRLTRTTPPSDVRAFLTTEDYRDAVNSRANSKRLRSLVAYTITYPVIVVVCNMPQLIHELLSTVLKRPLEGLYIAAMVLLYSQGFFLSLAFFSYPAVRHSAREMIHAAVQYWVIEQEEFWRMQHHDAGERNIRQQEIGDFPTDKRDANNFTSMRGRLYHFILCLTPEGRLARVQ
ncbi:hypothetical protein EC988_001501 [Linderina pennispora]|nr:hypothetical protein EC988_001501 [Linderina pennispora]